jgi:subtilase family serine protease
MACFALMRTDVGAVPGAIRSKSTAANSTAANSMAANSVPAGFGPAALDSAYKLMPTLGAGQTVAVVDAFNDPTADGDLAVYRSQYGLAACTVANGCLRIVNQSGATTPLPGTDTGWAGEESLDLDMVSAVCPACHIILVEANSAGGTDLYAAVDRAVAMGAKFVSNSWGTGEYAGETGDDAHFNHPGVAVVASSGDAGYGTAYPAASPYVTAVGGTTLSTSAATRGWTETAWSGAGSGCSAYEPKPAWQTAATSCATRAVTDVAAVADPYTGVAVYQTTGASGWVVYGGTSVAAPIVAATYALAGTPATGTNPASYLYARSAYLYDVTTGTNGTCATAVWCAAGTGWDGPTGLGTPESTAAFTNAAIPTLTMAAIPTQTTRVGTPVSLQLSASGGVPPYTWAAVSGLPAGLSVNAATGLVTGAPTAVHSLTVTVRVTDAIGRTAARSFNWVVTPDPSCTAAQLFGNPGFETGTATPWTTTPDVVSSNGGGSETAHTGTWFAWLDGYGTVHTDTLAQTVTVPAGCKAVLSFYLRVDTADTSTTVKDTTLTVQATVAGTTSTLATFSNLDQTGGYTLVTLPITGTGATTVTFTGAENASLPTSFVIDDTALNVT